mgnify:FL=1
MITLRELRTMSLEFRRVSSNFLNCDHDTADIALSRFYSYLKRTEWIWDFISDILTTTEFDFRDCFPYHSNGWREASIPVDEKQHFKAQFDYLEFLAERTPVNVLGEAMQYYHSSKKFTDIIQSFVCNTFKPMIDYINDAISKEMILIEAETKAPVPAVYQKIENNYGTANAQGTGTMTTANFSAAPVSDITDLLAKILPSLDSLSDIPRDEIDNVKDDLESVEEQLASSAPKKNRLKKAVGGIKKFFADFSMKVAVSMAAGAVTSADWSMLIQKLEEYIGVIG